MIEENKVKIIKAVNDGKITLKDIAKKLYISEFQLKLLLESWGVEITKKRKYKKIPMPEREGLMELYNKLGNTIKVAQYYNVGINTVNRWMKTLRIPTKKLGKMTKEEKAKYLEEHVDRLEGINL